MMKHKYFIHVLVTLVLVTSMLVSLTSGAMGKYTNAGLGLFSTLASVYFSDYKVVGSIIVDDGSGGSIEPDEESDSVWGGGDDIKDESTRGQYGWNDANDIAFTVVNDSEETLYLSFSITMALPKQWFIVEIPYAFYASYTLEQQNAESGEKDTYEGGFKTSTALGAPSNYTEFIQISETPLYWAEGDLGNNNYYLYQIKVKTDLKMDADQSYIYHFKIGEPEGVVSDISTSLTSDSAYHSIKITARTEP